MKELRNSYYLSKLASHIEQASWLEKDAFFGSSARGMLSNMGKGIAGGAGGIAGTLAGAMSGPIGMLKPAFQSIGQAAMGKLKEYAPNAMQTLGNLGQKASSTFGGFKQGVSDVAKELAPNAVDRARGVLSQGRDMMRNTDFAKRFRGSFNNAASVMRNAYKDI